MKKYRTFSTCPILGREYPVGEKDVFSARVMKRNSGGNANKEILCMKKNESLARKERQKKEERKKLFVKQFGEMN